MTKFTLSVQREALIVTLKDSPTGKARPLDPALITKLTHLPSVIGASGQNGTTVKLYSAGRSFPDSAQQKVQQILQDHFDRMAARTTGK